MSDPHDSSAPAVAGAADARDREEADDVAVRSLVKRALGADATAVPPPDFLAGVQRRIRIRSRGKFFADGWSTTHARTSYALAGLITVALALLAYVALVPTTFR
jgi:hypothetical protein